MYQGFKALVLLLQNSTIFAKNRNGELKMDVDLIADKVKELQHKHGLSEQTAIEILKMQQLSESLKNIEGALWQIYNTI